MTSSDFAEQLYHLLGNTALRTILKAPAHVLVNNACHGRPSAAVIEFEGTPPLAILVSHLHAPYARRTLVIGRTVLPEGSASTTKRQLCELIDTFLASFGVELDQRLVAPAFFVEN
jgi:hypothetical protein